MENVFHLVTENKANVQLEIDFTKHNIMQLILILYKKRWNKQLGRKFAILYLEKFGKAGIEDFSNNGICADEIKSEYAEEKMIYGAIH